MFILDFFLGGLMDQLIDWIYSQLVGFFGNFFSAMGNMGVELFDMPWVQSIVLFFSYLQDDCQGFSTNNYSGYLKNHRDHCCRWNGSQPLFG